MSEEQTGKEIWYTPGDFSPTYRLLVKGDEVSILFIQDIWPGYPGAKRKDIFQSNIDFINRPENKAAILCKAERGF